MRQTRRTAFAVASFVLCVTGSLGTAEFALAHGDECQSTNCTDANSRGGRSLDGAIGWGTQFRRDPRSTDDELRSHYQDLADELREPFSAR